jgi:hypothetical protein
LIILSSILTPHRVNSTIIIIEGVLSHGKV